MRVYGRPLHKGQHKLQVGANTMGATITAEEARDRADYVLVEKAAPDVSEEVPKLEPLPQFSVGVPAGWKDALYDKQH